VQLCQICPPGASFVITDHLVVNSVRLTYVSGQYVYVLSARLQASFWYGNSLPGTLIAVIGSDRSFVGLLRFCGCIRIDTTTMAVSGNSRLFSSLIRQRSIQHCRRRLPTYNRDSENMNLIGAKSFSVFLVSSLASASSFLPLSFGKHVQQNQQCKWDDTKCLAARGGSSLSSATTTVLNSAVASEESTAPAETFRSAYEPLPHLVAKINMDFKIDEGKTIVTSELFIEPNSSYNGKSRDLTLDGDETCVKLLSLSLNGKDLKEGTDYTLSPGKLILKNPPAGSLLKTVVEIVPEDNTQLSGLYKDGPMYCTQVSKEESQVCTIITVFCSRNLSPFRSLV
jgi:hypothetical protein